MGCSFSHILKRCFSKRKNTQDRSSPVFPRRITEEVFQYIDAPEPPISVPYRAQPQEPSPAIEYMNRTHYHEVKRIFGQSPHPYPLPPNYLKRTIPTEPPNPEPVVRRTLENRLEYRPPQLSTRPPGDVVHKSTRYIVPIYSDDSDSDVSVAELTITMASSDPVDIPGAVRKPTNYGFPVHWDNDACVPVINNQIVSVPNDSNDPESNSTASSESSSSHVSECTGSHIPELSGSHVSESGDTVVSVTSGADISGPNNLHVSDSKMSDLD